MEAGIAKLLAAQHPASGAHGGRVEGHPTVIRATADRREAPTIADRLAGCQAGEPPLFAAAESS
jgi:hypothetical protein